MCQLSYSDDVIQGFNNFILCRDCKKFVQNQEMAHECRQLCQECFQKRNRNQGSLEMKCRCGIYPFRSGY